MSPWFVVRCAQLAFALCSVSLHARAETPTPARREPGQVTVLMHDDVPVMITALSTLGRASFGKGRTLGGEIHVDQDIRLGTITHWSVLVGGSLGRLGSTEGSAWLLGANGALKYELDRKRFHGVEFGAAYDSERPLGHVPVSVFVGPYLGYYWEFAHRVFVTAETGLGFRSRGVGEPRALWSAIGLGADVLCFLLRFLTQGDGVLFCLLERSEV